MNVFIWEYDKLPSFEACGLLRSADGFIHMKRIGVDFELIIGVSGKAYIQEENEKFVIEEGSILLLSPGKTHFGYKVSDGPTSFYWVHFRLNNDYTTELPVISNDEIHNIIELPHYFFTRNNENLFVILKQLSYYYIQDKRNTLAASGVMLALLSEISDLYNIGVNKSQTTQKLKFSQIEKWITVNINRHITTLDIANEFGMNANYLATLFKKQADMTPTQYINYKKIQQAKKMFSLKDFSVKEVAYSLGFCNERYFMRVFKKTEGMTPTEFKKGYNSKYITYK